MRKKKRGGLKVPREKGRVAWGKKHEKYVRNNYKELSTRVMAEVLGVSGQTLRRKMDEWGLYNKKPSGPPIPPMRDAFYDMEVGKRYKVKTEEEEWNGVCIDSTKHLYVLKTQNYVVSLPKKEVGIQVKELPHV